MGSDKKLNSAVEGKSEGREEFLYDIWGSNHFCQRMKTMATAEDANGESQSFFAQDPETLMMMVESPRGTI